MLQLYIGSDLMGLGGVAASVGRERPSRQDEPETFEVPRERLGLPALLGGGCSLDWLGDVPRPARLSSSSLVGVGTGIESRRYCSVGKDTSEGKSATCSSGRTSGKVPG